MNPLASRTSNRSLPKSALGWASILAALYVGMSPRMSPGLYSHRLFRPFVYPEGQWDLIELEGLKRQDVYFSASDGSRLHGWYFERPGAHFVIMFNHGNTGNITGRINLARLLLQTGASLLMYDYRGYGRSEGRPTVKGIGEDGVSAFDYLVRDRGYKPSRIIIYGESLGTAVASEVAGDRPCGGIILQSGFTSLQRIGAEHFPLTKLYPRFLFPRPFLDMDSATRMETKKRPLLIIHGHKDQVVPFKHAQEIFERAAEPKMFVELPDCAHSDIWCNAPEVYVESIKTFIASLERAQH